MLVKKQILAVGLFSLLSGLSFSASAEKFGIVDISKIMAESKEASVVKTQLEAKFKPREQKLLALQKSIQADMEKLQRDDAVMTEAQKKSLQEKIMTARKEFETKGRAFQQEVNVAQNQAMQKLFSKVKVVVDDVAKAGKYDVIFQKDAVQYIAPDHDITSKVIEKLK